MYRCILILLPITFFFNQTAWAELKPVVQTGGTLVFRCLGRANLKLSPSTSEAVSFNFTQAGLNLKKEAGKTILSGKSCKKNFLQSQQSRNLELKIPQHVNLELHGIRSLQSELDHPKIAVAAVEKTFNYKLVDVGKLEINLAGTVSGKISLNKSNKILPNLKDKAKLLLRANDFGYMLATLKDQTSLRSKGDSISIKASLYNQSRFKYTGCVAKNFTLIPKDETFANIQAHIGGRWSSGGHGKSTVKRLGTEARSCEELNKFIDELPN